jgi:hypothetical protein
VRPVVASVDLQLLRCARPDPIFLFLLLEAFVRSRSSPISATGVFGPGPNAQGFVLLFQFFSASGLHCLDLQWLLDVGLVSATRSRVLPPDQGLGPASTTGTDTSQVVDCAQVLIPEVRVSTTLKSLCPCYFVLATKTLSTSFVVH